MMIVPGPLCYLIYKQLVQCDSIQPLVLIAEKSNIAVIIATFAFTMLGFLAAVIAILFSLANSTVFKKYKKGEYLSIFFKIYYFAIINLILTLVLALLSYGKGTSSWAMQASLASTVNNLFQIGLITFIIINLSHRAFHNEEKKSHSCGNNPPK